MMAYLLYLAAVWFVLDVMDSLAEQNMFPRILSRIHAHKWSRGRVHMSVGVVEYSKDNKDM